MKSSTAVTSVSRSIGAHVITEPHRRAAERLFTLERSGEAIVRSWLERPPAPPDALRWTLMATSRIGYALMVALMIVPLAALSDSSPAAGQQQAQSASATDPCEDALTQFELNDCHGREAKRAEARLNALLKELGGVLNKSQLSRLMTVQERWTSYRAASCQWHASFLDGASMQPMQYAACMASETWARIDDLKHYLCEGFGLTGDCAASRRYNRKPD